MSSKAPPAPCRSKRKSGMILFSTRMSSSLRSRSRSAWVYAENKPLQVLGVPLVPPRCGIWARRHHAEMTFMNDFWFTFVPPPPASTSFFALLPYFFCCACFRVNILLKSRDLAFRDQTGLAHYHFSIFEKWLCYNW